MNKYEPIMDIFRINIEIDWPTSPIIMANRTIICKTSDAVHATQNYAIVYEVDGLVSCEMEIRWLIVSEETPPLALLPTLDYKMFKQDTTGRIQSNTNELIKFDITWNHVSRFKMIYAKSVENDLPDSVQFPGYLVLGSEHSKIIHQQYKYLTYGFIK